MAAICLAVTVLAVSGACLSGISTSNSSFNGTLVASDARRYPYFNGMQMHYEINDINYNWWAFDISYTQVDGTVYSVSSTLVGTWTVDLETMAIVTGNGYYPVGTHTEFWIPTNVAIGTVLPINFGVGFDVQCTVANEAYVSSQLGTTRIWNLTFSQGNFKGHVYYEFGTGQLIRYQLQDTFIPKRWCDIWSTNVPIWKQPVASFTWSPSSPQINQVVQFTDTSVGSIVAWNWSFGDGTPGSTLKNPTHVFTSTGTFAVKLTVTDYLGYTSTITKNVVVSPATIGMHVLSISMSSTKVFGGYKVSTKVTVHDQNGVLLSGVTVTVDLLIPGGTHKTLTGNTGADGSVTLSYTSSKRGTYTSTVTNLVKTGYVYQASQNHMTSKSLVV